MQMGADVRMFTERKMERDSMAKLGLTPPHISMPPRARPAVIAAPSNNSAPNGLTMGVPGGVRPHLLEGGGGGLKGSGRRGGWDAARQAQTSASVIDGEKGNFESFQTHVVVSLGRHPRVPVVLMSAAGKQQKLHDALLKL
ncbi:hypothetical protein NQZ68_012113 [Dissostichus eleginoides]|nr:hypothetical protein NQZ68_012113 [Dissostichus eleginoides]